MRSELSVAAVILSCLGVAPGGTAAQQGATLADLAWLEGHWIGELDVGDGIARAEAHYFEPRGGVITGSFRLTREGRTLVVELLSLLEMDGALEMRLRHFDAALTPWEGEAPIVMRLESWSETLFRFRNPVDDNPRVSHLEFLDRDRFRAWSEIYDAEGRPSRIDITYRRDPGASR